MFSYGNQFKIAQAIELLEKSGKQLFILTPYASIPCQALLYLWLRSNSIIYLYMQRRRNFKLELHQLASGPLQVVELSFLVLGIYAHGLNNKFWQFAINKFILKDTTFKITSLKKHCHLINCFYVTSIYFDSLNSAVVYVCFLIEMYHKFKNTHSEFCRHLFYSLNFGVVFVYFLVFPLPFE